MIGCSTILFFPTLNYDVMRSFKNAKKFHKLNLKCRFLNRNSSDTLKDKIKGKISTEKVFRNSAMLH